MKAEINLENKAMFFAIYWGQNVYRKTEVITFESTVFGFISDEGCAKTGYILLKPLLKISDEDSIQVFDYIFGGREANKNKSRKEKITFGKEWASCYAKFFNYGSGHFGYETGNVIDLLRSKSYALPFMNLSVEEMIGSGWIKLIEE